MPYTPYTYTSPDDPAREDDGLFTDPVDAWARLRRTRKFIETRTFGTTAEAQRAGRRVRKIHEPLFLAAMRAIHRAEWAGDLRGREDY
jgi:hypothetical protein